MKRISLSLLAIMLVISLSVPSAFANGNGNAYGFEKGKGKGLDIAEQAKLRQQLDEITKGTGFERTDEPLQEGTERLEFDSVEEFEEWVKAIEEQMKELDEEMATEAPENNNLPELGTDGDFSIMATDLGRKRIYTYNPLNVLLPDYMYIDFTYNWSYYNGYKKASSVSGVKSWDCCLGKFTEWYQTSDGIGYPVDGGRNIYLKVQGYHQLGVQIYGLPLNYKYPRTWSAYYYL